jgi:hypothetical protein
MTEEEWLTATDPGPLLEFLRYKTSERKRRLTGCGLAQSTWLDRQCRAAIPDIERYADGEVEESLMAGRRKELHSLRGRVPRTSEEVLAITLLIWAAGQRTGEYDLMSHVGFDSLHDHPNQPQTRSFNPSFAGRTKYHQAGILRDIFGNPFRPVAADPSWLTSTVVALAHAIYAERAFDRMPVLADALEESGCDHPDVLAHCRCDGPHVRGCWVVDSVLGKL